ncbi:MAG TPA: four helix bundle protein [Ignavibacteriaceae bacterium]|nr:four helix bundle protein [Ignavibacteriaceae bacterium]
MDKNIKKFEDLNVWKESMKLTVDIYKLLKDCKDYGLKDQIQRSAVSIPSNIAEGYDRQTNKEFIQFLFIAKGSCAELRTQIYLIIALNIIERETGNLLIERTHKISGMLYNLIKSRKEKF